VRDPNNPPPRRLTQAIGRLTDRLRILLSALNPSLNRNYWRTTWSM
jgi:hypothetical protein